MKSSDSPSLAVVALVALGAGCFNPRVVPVDGDRTDGAASDSGGAPGGEDAIGSGGVVGTGGTPGGGSSGGIGSGGQAPGTGGRAATGGTIGTGGSGTGGRIGTGGAGTGGRIGTGGAGTGGAGTGGRIGTGGTGTGGAGTGGRGSGGAGTGGMGTGGAGTGGRGTGGAGTGGSGTGGSAGAGGMGGAPCPGTPPPDYGKSCGHCGGAVTCNGTCSRADTSCAPTGEFFHIRNMQLGDTRFLDSYSGTPSQVFMGDSCCSGSAWRITPTSDGYYLFSNLSFGPGQVLEPEPDGSKLFLRPSAGTPTQKWIITAIGGGYFTLTNVGFVGGNVMGLDGDPPNDPAMGIALGVPGEAWKIAPPQ